MLKLKNITIHETLLEADYTPEDSTVVAHVTLDMVTGESTYTTATGYETTYPTMAIGGLKRILEERRLDPLPTERIVMWY